MIRYRDDRSDDRNMPDDRRQDRDDNRGLMERIGDFFQGRDDDRSRSGDDRYGDRSGMGPSYLRQGQGYGDHSRSSDDRLGMGLGFGMDQGYDRDRNTGMTYSGSGRSYGQGYGAGGQY